MLYKLNIDKGILCTIQEGCYICCIAGLEKHKAQICIGDKLRIMMSYGFLIPKEKLGKVEYYYPLTEFFKKEDSSNFTLQDL